MKNLAKILVKWELFILAGLIPMWVFYRPGTLLLFAIPMLVWLASYYLNRSFIPNTILDRPILILAGLSFLSIFVTPSLEDSLPKLLGVYLGICLFYGVVRLRIDETKYRNFLLVGAVLVGDGIVLLGIAGGRFPNKIPLISDFLQATKISFLASPNLEYILHPNALSGSLLLVFPLAVVTAISFSEKGPRKSIYIFLVISALSQLFFLVIAQSRGAWLALALTLGIWVSSQRLPRLFHLPLFGPLVVHIFLLISIFLVQPVQAQAILYLTKKNLFHTLGQRIIIWDWAVKILQDFPLTGIGYNTFRNMAPVLYPRSALTDIDFSHAHNIFLDIGVTLGIGAIIGLIWMWWAVTSLLVSNIQEDESQLNFLPTGLLLGWMAFFMFNLIDTIPMGSKLGTLLWVFLGFVHIFIDLRTVDN